MPSAYIFTGITSEGGILPTDFLAELTNPKSDIEGLAPTTYRLAPGERIGDQVNRSWNRLKGCWVNFLRSIAAKQPGEPTTTETRERWLFPLFQEMDFGRLTLARPIEIDGKSYPVSHGWGPVPIHLVGTHVDLDRRTPGAVGAAKASPHSLVQQVLNASDNHLWGIISNGFTLRLVRDNVALTRIAYLEWDLQTILDGDLYPEFFLLWIVCHQSRFEAPPEGQPNQCWIEKWKKQAEEKGLRALENLRPGVEKAIASIGSGLVFHKANQTLRLKLSSGQLLTQDFYRQILRIIYRMLFLFVAEDRGLIHPPLPGEEQGKETLEAALKARRRYRDFYSIGRLRDLTLHRAGTPHPDLWQVFQLISQFLGSDSGSPELALPALGSFLWSPESTPDLNDGLVSNRNFLEAVQALAFIRDENVRRAIDYKNLGAEELGSVYESLLELHPIVNADAGTFELQTAAGHERKTTGSYYTDDSLVQSLLDSALEPVIAETIKGKEGTAAAEVLLKLKICDPAVGSGHFLISAAHRLARRLAAARTGEEEPSPEATRSALREIIGRCLYGVDINPMAAELCRVSLWLEALEPGKPLSFLDHHIRVGNSLLGATPKLIAQGIPDDAFKPIEGDDKNACSVLKKRNKAERAGIGGLFVAEDKTNLEALRRTAFALEAIGDDTPEMVRRKAVAFEESQHNYDYLAAKRLADAWCAAFVIQKTFKPGTAQPFGLTQRHLTDLAKGNALPTDLGPEVERLASACQFFHFHLAFPEVFTRGGFDCVLGNPPWEQVELNPEEFFAHLAPSIANAAHLAAREFMMTEVFRLQPALKDEYEHALQESLRLQHFLHACGLYYLSSKGRLNTSNLFVDLSRHISKKVGIIVPTTLATGSFTQEFFQELLGSGALVSLFGFDNGEGLFPAVKSSFRFCLLTLGHRREGVNKRADFVFFAQAINELRDEQRHFRMSLEELFSINPNTGTCPVFKWKQDAELSMHIQRCVPVLHDERPEKNQNSWSFKAVLMFMTNTASRLFRSKHANDDRYGHGEPTKWLPFLEAKAIAPFDHRAATCESGSFRKTKPAEKTSPNYICQPRNWISAEQVEAKLLGHWERKWLLVWQDVTDTNTMSRTLLAIICPLGACGDGLPVLCAPQSSVKLAVLYGMLNSFVLDYCTRQKVGGVHLRFHVFQQLPVLPSKFCEDHLPWDKDATGISWLLPRVLELTYTAWDLESFAQDCGWSGPPFRWDEERRFLLRCELDAAFFHLYLPAAVDGQWKPARIAEGAVRDETPEELANLKRYLPTPRDAVAYIMDTFPIVRRRDEGKHGEYRTKRVILEIYDEMAEAIRTGKPYQTRLNPPPGPPADEKGNFLPLPEWNPGQLKPANWPSHIHLPKEK